MGRGVAEGRHLSVLRRARCCAMDASSVHTSGGVAAGGTAAATAAGLGGAAGAAAASASCASAASASCAAAASASRAWGIVGAPPVGSCLSDAVAPSAESVVFAFAPLCAESIGCSGERAVLPAAPPLDERLPLGETLGCVVARGGASARANFLRAEQTPSSRVAAAARAGPSHSADSFGPEAADAARNASTTMLTRGACSPRSSRGRAAAGAATTRAATEETHSAALA